MIQPLDVPNDRTAARHFRIRVPLATRENGMFKKYGGLTPTFPAKANFTCIIKYPKVSWHNPPPPYDDKDYFYLFQVGSGATVGQDQLPNYFAAGATHHEFNGEYHVSGSAPPHTDPAFPDDFHAMEIRDKTLPSVCVKGVADPLDPLASITDPNWPFSAYVTGWSVGATGPRTVSDVDHIRCGKPICDDWALDVYDNNPFLHWASATAGGMARDDVPEMDRFFWEVGHDIRNHGWEPPAWTTAIDTNDAQTGVGWEGSGDDQLGFDVAKTVAPPTYQYHFKPVETCGLNGGSPCILSNVAMGKWKFDHGSLVHHPAVPTARGVDVTSFTNNNEFKSLVDSNIGSWFTWQRDDGTLDPAHFDARVNGRWCRWYVPKGMMVMPWFLNDVSVENLAQYAAGTDRYYYDTTADTFGAPAGTADLTGVGSIGLGDTVPPNVKIEITDYASGQTVAMILQTDMEYDLTATDWSSFQDDYDRVYVSEDQRAVAVRLGLDRPFQKFLHQPVNVTNNQGNYRYLVGATKVHYLDVAMPEDVPYVLKVWAVDNATPSASLTMEVRSINIDPLTATPFRLLGLDPVHGIVEGKALVSGTHRYPQEGTKETIRVRVSDQSGNMREVQLNFTTAAHNLDFRVISDRLQKQ